MTLTEYSTFICSRLNQSDATSVALCKQFIQRRYDMIFSMRNWRDIMTNIASNLTDTTSGLLDLPATIDRVISIRINGDRMLVPTDSPLIMQLNPQAFEQSSIPFAFEEFKDGTTSKIRFLPVPNQAYALLITGRKAFVNLTNDTDTPIIRGIDNALIAFATADMLERQRQYGKAQAKVEEGTSLLNEMIRVETELSGNMPRIIPMVEPSGGYGAFEGNDWLYRG